MPDTPRKVADDDYDIATLFETVRRCNIDMLQHTKKVEDEQNCDCTCEEVP